MAIQLLDGFCPAKTAPAKTAPAHPDNGKAHKPDANKDAQPEARR